LQESLVWRKTSTLREIITTLLCLYSSLGKNFIHLVNGSYFLFELPSNLVIRRIGAGNWLAFIIICWGAVSIGMGFSPNWQILAVTRALLGIFEVILNSAFTHYRLVSFPAASILSVVGTRDMKSKPVSHFSTCQASLPLVFR
jgi:hypothetical protein